MITRKALLEGIARAHCLGRRKATLWGQTHLITPIFGDGLKPMWLETLAHRPNYYVFLADSKWATSNFKDNPFCDHVEEVLQEIECQYGRHYEEWEHENGRTYTRYRYFPALDDGCGYGWGELEFEL